MCTYRSAGGGGGADGLGSGLGEEEDDDDDDYGCDTQTDEISVSHLLFSRTIALLCAGSA